MIWDDVYLDRLRADAEQDICNRINCLFFRYAIQITSGLSVYTLPVTNSRIRRVTWKGRKLDPLTFQEMCDLDPQFAYADSTNKYETPTGLPRYYILHPTNIRDLRFYPVPNEDILIDGLDVYGVGVDTNVVISCFRNIDGTDPKYQLPDYIYRRTVKAYVLWKAFSAEGPGQDSRAAAYQKSKYSFYIEKFSKLNSDIFVSKRYSLGREDSRSLNTSRDKWRLPSNY